MQVTRVTRGDDSVTLVTLESGEELWRLGDSLKEEARAWKRGDQPPTRGVILAGRVLSIVLTESDKEAWQWHCSICFMEAPGAQPWNTETAEQAVADVLRNFFSQYVRVYAPSNLQAIHYEANG